MSAFLSVGVRERKGHSSAYLQQQRKWVTILDRLIGEQCFEKGRARRCIIIGQRSVKRLGYGKSGRRATRICVYGGLGGGRSRCPGCLFVISTALKMHQQRLGRRWTCVDHEKRGSFPGDVVDRGGGETR